jgi:RNA polymerase-binding transcription factor DksA
VNSAAVPDKEDSMRQARQSALRDLGREVREVRQRISALRRQPHRRFGVPDLPADGAANIFETVLGISGEQHEEVVRRRLAEKSSQLAEALERVRNGTYGLCRECGRRIPPRRLQAVPMATLCVSCQAEQEIAHAA